MRQHKIPRIYLNEALTLGTSITLGKEQAHYLITVLRKTVADQLLVFNGKEGEFLAAFTEVAKNKAVIQLTQQSRSFTPSPPLTLIFSPVKNIKPEFIVQKATELGVSAIIPCCFTNTVKTGVNLDRLHAVACEAAEQCERLDVPAISELITLKQLIPILQQKEHILFCDESGQGKPIYEVLQQQQRNGKWALVVGPEGGFTPAEIDYFYSLPNLNGVGLGSRILKAETAIIAVLSIWQAVLGDFNQLPDFRENCGAG